MEQVDVVGVMGTCAPERRNYAAEAARTASRTLFTARRLDMSPDPVDEAQALAPWADTASGAVIEFPATVSPTEIIGRFAHPASPTRLIGLTCVVDAMHLIDDLLREDHIVRTSRTGEKERRARSLVTATQIEYASTIALVGWESLPTPELSIAMAVVSALSPRARIRLHPAPMPAPEIPTAFTAVQNRPGWIGVLSDDFAPHMTDPRVSTVHYAALRPFHPTRLSTLLDDHVESGRHGMILRSAGFCRLATRPGITAHWEHVGTVLSLPPAATDDELGDDEELLTAGQDIVFFGLDIDRAGLFAALDDACLTDDEFAAGPTAWRAFEDPFPAWEGVAG